MSGIHDEILKTVKTALQYYMIDNVPEADTTRAGYIKLGDLQGDPDPDVARISITLHENDPDGFIKGVVTGMKDAWDDEIYDIEVGGRMTWKRRFTIKTRCLLENSKENLSEARTTASTVRTRLEHSLPKISFSSVSVDGEYVSRGIISSEIKGEMLQGGGPPTSYDYFIKIRFEVLTTK